MSTPSVVVDLNSTAVHAALNHRDTPDISLTPIYANDGASSELIFDPILPRNENDNIYTLFSDGILYNKNATAPFINHIYTSLNLSEDYIKELPLTIAQNAWFDKKQLHTLSEIVYEELEVPLFSLHERQLCTAYAMSKPNNCIIVDFENNFLSVTPISNGKVIKKGILKSRFGGDFINLFIKEYLTKKEIPLDSLLPIDYQKLKLSNSFHQFAITQTLTDFKKSILDISPLSIDEKIFKTPGNTYSASISRLDQINNFIQPIFSPYDSYSTIIGNPPSSLTPESEGLGQLIFKSLKNIGGPASLYADLLNNIIIQGENSGIPGFEDVVIADLRLYINDFQISSYLNQDNMDRGIETWIGANILSKFNDLYFSRQDYLEQGADAMSSRFF